MTVATSYTELMNGIQAQVELLGLKLTDFDDLAGFPSGLSGKVFGMLQVKRLGPEKVFDALRAAGLRMRLEIDPEQHAKMKSRISENYNPRNMKQARNGHSASMPCKAVLSRILKPMAKMGGKARWKGKTQKERSDYARMIANARWKAERKRRNAASSRARRLSK